MIFSFLFFMIITIIILKYITTLKIFLQNLSFFSVVQHEFFVYFISNFDALFSRFSTAISGFFCSLEKEIIIGNSSIYF
jgi:hypothetical protein